MRQRQLTACKPCTCFGEHVPSCNVTHAAAARAFAAIVTGTRHMSPFDMPITGRCGPIPVVSTCKPLRRPHVAALGADGEAPRPNPPSTPPFQVEYPSHRHSGMVNPQNCTRQRMLHSFVAQRYAGQQQTTTSNPHLLFDFWLDNRTLSRRDELQYPQPPPRCTFSLCASMEALRTLHMVAGGPSRRRLGTPTLIKRWQPWNGRPATAAQRGKSLLRVPGCLHQPASISACAPRSLSFTSLSTN